MTRRQLIDIVSGLILIIFAIVTLRIIDTQIITRPLSPMQAVRWLTAATLPKLAVWSILGVGVVLVGGAVRSMRSSAPSAGGETRDEEAVEEFDIRRVLITWVAVTLYGIVVPRIGFVEASIALWAVLNLLYFSRRDEAPSRLHLISSVVVMVVLPFLMIYAFKQHLFVPLPEGVLSSWLGIGM